MATTEGGTQVRAKKGLTVEATEQMTRQRADALQNRMTAAQRSSARLNEINTRLQDAISKGDIDEIGILNADFKSAQEEAKLNATDLAQAMIGLGEGFKDIGQALEEIQDLSSDEQKVIDDAKELVASKKASLEKRRLELEQAKDKPALFGWRERAVASAESEVMSAKNALQTAEEGIKTAEQVAEHMRRTRLESMTLDQSLQRMQAVTQRIIEMAKGRIAEIEGNLAAVETGRRATVDDLKQYAVEVEEGDKAIKQGEAELQALRARQAEIVDQNSAEWTELMGQIKEKQNELGEIESTRNKAHALSQDGQRFLEGLSVQEETQRSLLSFHKIWIATLEEGVRQRSTLYESHLGIIRAAGDQQAMDMVDRVGVETDERVTEDAARHLSAARRGMIDRFERMPEQVRRMRQIAEASAKSKAAFDDKMQVLLDEFHKNFGTPQNYDDVQKYRGQSAA